MPLTRLDNLISSKTGKYLYVSPDDFNATDALSNRGNSPVTPFKSIQRAFLEIARYSYLPGPDNDRFDQFSIMLMPGIHYIDNRPGLVDTSGIDVFGFDQALNAWTDNSILDISNPNNVLYKFNNTEGGAIIPRGSSLVGYDLRRTVVRPLYVPDPSSVTIPRSAIFNVTGGCYFWQFTIKDGQTTSESPLYNPATGTGEVYYDPQDFTRKAAPNYSHHKLTIFEYADQEELGLFYRKIAKAFSAYQPTIDDPGEFDFNIQENRIVGPLSDSRVIESLNLVDATTDPSIPASTTEVEVTTKVDHGYFAGQFVAISNTGIDDILEGFFAVKEIDPTDPRKFKYEVPIVVSAIGSGLSSGQTISVDTTPALGQNAQTLAEVDSVESASPYVFNCSIRSVWGICGIWANGLKATGFKSMVIAQYTGVSLQRDDRAFIRYDEYSNTWNQASLTDAFATVPYHAKGDSYWKDDWRNFHVRATEDAFIQNVSIFAVGFADHFLMESGGDMSITNSNSNFGNTSLHAIGFKGFAFNQDKGGYITDIIPPQQVVQSAANTKKTNYYTADISGTTSDTNNFTKLFLGSDEILDPLDRPAVSINGYRLGAKSNDKLYVKLDRAPGTGEIFNVSLEPTGFVKYIATGSILNPSGLAINNVFADAANLIESNRRMIQEEVFGYILEKYPRLQNISYVNPGLNPAANRYFDARNLILANRQEIVDTAYSQTTVTYPSTTITRDNIGLIVDAIAEDLRDGGNANTIDQVRDYFTGAGTLSSFVGQESEIVFAFNRARDLCKKAIANLLTVQADLYDPSPTSILAPYGVTPGYTGSAAEAASLTTNGVTVDSSNVLDPAGRFKDARNLINSNREFILDGALAEVAVYHPDFYMPGDTASNDQSRYADAFRLIRRNSKEIADRALAAIALNHPDFSFPGDPVTDSTSRFADAYRLIQQNKTEIVDDAFDHMNATSPPSPLPTDYTNKCKRDIGYYVDAISLDVFLGSNEYAYRFAAEYFDANGAPITNGLSGEEASSNVAFTEAARLMKLAVTNQLTVKDLTVTADPATGSNTDPASCANVRSAIDSLNSIVTTIIAAGNLNSVPLELNKGTLIGGELKCYRDINYFIDAVSVDLFCGGNRHTRTFTQQYFTSGGTPISNGLVGEVAESITAFNAASAAMQQAVYNALYYKDLTVTAGPPTYGGSGTVPNTDPTACTDVQNAISNLASIATDAISNGNLTSLPPENAGTLLAGETKCRRDIGHIVDAVSQDLWFGGNEYTIAAIKEYFRNGSLFSGGIYTTPRNEVAPSITAFRRAQDLMNRAVNNQYYNRDLTITLDNTGDPPVFSDIHSNASQSILDNKRFIAKEAYERMKVAYPSYAPQTGNTEQDCLDDVYDVLDQIAYDIKFGGNARTYDAANVYVTNTLNGSPVTTFIDPERDEAARVFQEAKNVAFDVINNVAVTRTGANTETQVFDFTQTDDWDDDDAPLPQCGSAIAAADTLFGIIIQAIGTDAGVGNLTGITRTAPSQPTTFTLGNCSDVLSAIDTLISISADALYAGNLNSLPILSTGEWDCANVRSTIETLFDIATEAISGSTLGGLPTLNSGDFVVNAEVSKCFRDVAYIVDAVVNDLRLGGNINSVQAGEAYYVGNNLTYIDGERAETIDAWNYVGQMATAAMRNFDFLAFNCSTTTGSAIIDVNDTRGVLIGMSVVEYDNTNPVSPAYVNGLLQSGATPVYTNIPAGTYVKRIVSNTQIELGVQNSRLNDGATVNALQTSTTTNLYFKFERGQWANRLPRTVTVGPASSNPDIIQDTTVSPTNRECAGTADAIQTLIGNITTIINSGLGSVARQDQTVNTALLSSRATVFTIDTTGTGSSNPHNFETGTPVRLVPRPRFDRATGRYVDVDKRLVRLPNGFETNRTYYVIAPGRSTRSGGEEYNNTTFFNGSDQTKLMLATSKENAAAGIYIYASETESIDPNVEIDIFQFVIDDNYDLHNYTANLVSGSLIQTDISHIFDVPSAATTPQKVFIRTIEGGSLPVVSSAYATNPDVAVVDPSSAINGRINPNKEFFVRYQSPKTITLHITHADAINDVNPITFSSGSGLFFKVFSNKRRSPVKFDPTFTFGSATSGKWYINCKDEVTSAPASVYQENIFWRIHRSDYSDRPKTTDMWFERLDDTRDKDDRTYKIRYVIPKYLENARDPINGFVLKTRTDDTRKLVPQKILLKPVSGTVYGARFENPVQAGEYIGYNTNDFTTNSLNLDSAYDPYKKDTSSLGVEYRAFAKFTSGIQATIQSGRYIEDELDPSIKYLELTVFDHAVDTRNYPGLRNELFTTVKITAPQGGSFVTNKTQSITANRVEWSGNSSGIANIHAYYSVGGDHYLIIKNVRGGKLEYSEFTTTTFTQGSVFADMLEDQDMGKSLPLKTLIRKGYPEYYYKQNGANVYTITPGDRVQDDAGVEYYVESVEDAGIIEDTFYVFSYETLQRRIAGQQDGIYYLTALRGNVSPFPTGAGVSTNFRNFKFSQPVSKLYPLNYKNDPLWFKNSGTTPEEKNLLASFIDPPQTYSAADNYIHGLVTVNDFKGSVTREGVEDLLNNPAFVLNTYTGDNAIKAQLGNATSGSEDRRIPIAGDSTVVSDQRYYVELRRPSIARAGNHTFEYLGFGPGNYSTGLPARQEIVLTPEQDFYSQSKKQDAGIVFYTGINSQGDLYIGNRRINAITGEETFIDAAVLSDDGDDEDVIGGLVTTFDTPVTFNQNITVVGGDGNLVNSFESPVLIAVQDNDLTDQRDVLIIRSNVSSTDPVTGDQQDENLDRTAFVPPTYGDIRLSKNRIQSAIFGLNARRNGQEYSIQTHITGASPSNITPNQTALIASSGSRIAANQLVSYGGVIPKSGDILLKGLEVGSTGSLGWIFSNYFEVIPNNSIFTITFDATNIVKLTFVDATSGIDIANQALGITAGSQIRISNYYPDSRLNLTWNVYSPSTDPFLVTNNYVHFQIVDAIPAAVENWQTIVSAATGTPPSVQFSNSNWKEVGVIGSEAIRTETETIGDYKLGINTVARTHHDAHANAFVSADTEPRANLDVVGTTFISGKTITNYLSHPTLAARTLANQNNALLVGGDSAAPDDRAVLRVSTTPGPSGFGRLSINSNLADLTASGADHFIVGSTSFVGDATLNGNINLVIANIDTSSASVNLFNSATSLRFAQSAEDIEIANGTTNTNPQNIRIGNYASSHTLTIGDAATTTVLNVHRNSTNSTIDIGSVANNNATYTSNITLGGAFLNNASLTSIKTRNINLDGDVNVGSGFVAGSGTGKLYSLNSSFELLSASGGPSNVLFATTASSLQMGSQGGTTTIRNALRVNARADFDGDILLNGGINAGGFEVTRGVFGTTPAAQAQGSLTNFNVDLYVKVSINKTLDTPGSSTLSATTTTLNLSEVVSPGQISVGDFLLLDESATFTGAPAGYTPDEDRSEIVRVVSLTNLTNTSDPGGIRVEVQRGVDGTTAQTHPDNLPIFKLNKSANASYTTSNITAADVNVTTAEFGGSINPGNYLRINGTEFVKVVLVLTALTSIQSLRVNDGGSPAITVFDVESTTGNTFILGEADVHKTLTVVGSTVPSTEFFRVNNGAVSPTVTFEVDSTNGNTKVLGNLSVGVNFDRFTVTAANGNTNINGGNFTIKDTTGSTNKLRLENSTGNLTISGLLTGEATTGTNTFASDLRINGGDFTVNNGTSDLFVVNNNGTIDLGGIDYFYGPTGARRWDYVTVSSGGFDVTSNINYFVNATGDLYIRLPRTPRNGDMIRFVDIGGNLTYNLKLIIRAATSQKIQNDGTNTAPTVTGVSLADHNGGELNVTTPHAAFGLIYAGPLNSDGTSSGVPTAQQGWWLMEI